jgi:ATP-dependent Clp protease ATP-binding subunit ClpB
VDDIVFFKPLRKEEVKKIIDLQFVNITERLQDRNIQLTLSEAAKEHIINNAYDPVYGARPIKRYMQKNMETFIGRALIAGDIKDGDSIVIDSEEGKLMFDHR